VDDDSDERTKTESNKLKYLARAYLCRSSELNTEKMSPKLAHALNIQVSKEEKTNIDTELTAGTDEQVTEDSLIVLIQVISENRTETTDNSPTSLNQTLNLTGGDSRHKLNALVVNGDRVNLFPCVFRERNRSKGKKQL